MPVDPATRMRTLPNGLRYYLRRHQEPQKRASLRLAVNAGSVLETEQQRGLAHFVEHMAFNGTRLFKKQQMVDFIEKVGMRFGQHANASTSFDETIYMFDVPTDDQAVLEKGLLILQQIAADVSFDPQEVDRERRGAGRGVAQLGRGAGHARAGEDPAGAVQGLALRRAAAHREKGDPGTRQRRGPEGVLPALVPARSDGGGRGG